MTLLVNLYESGKLIMRILCESADEAAGVVTKWEAVDGIQCEIEDLSTSHLPEDVLTPEPEDAFEDDDRESDFGDVTH
jgi:hypothetical protein